LKSNVLPLNALTGFKLFIGHKQVPEPKQELFMVVISRGIPLETALINL
jgi:hypothetical protein